MQELIDRKTKIDRMKEKIKNSKNMFFGIDVGDLNLTSQEKKQLVGEGFNFTNARPGPYTQKWSGLILTYSQLARQKDLRNKVLNTIKLRKV